MRTGVFLRWLAHPLTIVAIAVLLLNDHVFKQAWPGLVTGKLSDVAGLVVAPPVLGLLFGLFLADRIGAAAAVLVTGVGFALVKLTTAWKGWQSAASTALGAACRSWSPRPGWTSGRCRSPRSAVRSETTSPTPR